MPDVIWLLPRLLAVILVVTAAGCLIHGMVYGPNPTPSYIPEDSPQFIVVSFQGDQTDLFPRGDDLSTCCPGTALTGYHVHDRRYDPLAGMTRVVAVKPSEEPPRKAT